MGYYVEKLREIQKKEGKKGYEMAGILGVSYGWYRSTVSRGNDLLWVKAFVLGYEMGLSGCVDVVSDLSEIRDRLGEILKEDKA